MEFFKGIDKIKYEGPNSKNLMAFAHYNAEEVILGKKMKDHLKYSMSYWHTLTGEGNDPFGDATMDREWNGLSPMEKAKARVKAGFEFMEKMG
ncbi:MAG: xylose isomerase, partial [Fusobacteriaceae bacterium]